MPVTGPKAGPGASGLGGYEALFARCARTRRQLLRQQGQARKSPLTRGSIDGFLPMHCVGVPQYLLPPLSWEERNPCCLAARGLTLRLRSADTTLPAALARLRALPASILDHCAVSPSYSMPATRSAPSSAGLAACTISPFQRAMKYDAGEAL